MTFSLTTPRLSIAPLSLHDHAFIQELVNSEGWIRFIGERNIKNTEQAQAYIKKIIDNPQTDYWVARDTKNIPVGIVTFIKRDYLDHYDIGFAFLPQYSGQGYALEATTACLNHLGQTHSIIQASTLPDNQRSIQLLEKLDFEFEKEFFRDNTKLWLYRWSSSSPK